jgi:hypothetical protein
VDRDDATQIVSIFEYKHEIPGAAAIHADRNVTMRTLKRLA